MTIVDKYLKELAQNNRRVIIPDLGAFLLKENPDGTKTIIFSSFLRYNDGFLEESIMQKSQLSKPEVASAIKKSVNEIKRVLRNRKNYNIEGFGSFSFDDKGAVQFVADEKVVANMPEVLPEAASITKPVNEDKGQADAEKIIADTPLVQEPVVAPPSIMPGTPPPTNAPPYQAQVETRPANERINQKPDIDAYNEAKKRGRLLWVIIFLLVIIVFLLTLLYLCTTNSDLCFLRKKTTETSQATPIISLPGQKTIDDKDSNNVKMLVSRSATANTDLQYYVIAGCFSEKINAERFLQQSIEQGHTASEILPRIGELFPVSIGKSPDINEAERIQAVYNEKYDEEAWLYRTY